MKLIVLDTETTGFHPKDDRIVQLAYLICDTNTKFIEQTNFYIDPQIQINNSHIHGITDEFVKDSYKFIEIAQIFLDDLDDIDLVIGHNIQFDINFLKEELRRTNLVGTAEPSMPNDIGVMPTSKRLDDIQVYDTMKNSVNICKIRGQFGSYKYPKLNELYQHFFKRDFDNQHNAVGDVVATFQCYKRLHTITA